MASNINTTDIDIEFPVPGQDNDSQGFRDNFTTIQDNFVAAKSEIETLQQDTVKVNVDTTFLTAEGGNPATMINANLKAYTETYYSPAGGNVSGSVAIDFRNGGYQFFRVAGTTNFTFSNWPSSGRYGKVIVHLSSDGSSRTVSFDNTEGNLLYDDASNVFWNLAGGGSGSTISSSSNPHIIEFWTYNSGTTVFAKYLGQFTTTPGE